MALTRTETQLTWSSASSITLDSGTSASDSDAFTFDATDVAASIQVSADNAAATPGATDVLYVYIKWTTGDVLTGGGDDYDTTAHAQFFMLLNNYGTSGGEDPARKTLDLPVSAKGFKLYVNAPNATTNNIVVKARVSTQRAA